MDSEEFFKEFARAIMVSRHHGEDVREVVCLDEFYQHFAERFRRENEAHYRHFCAVGEGYTAVERIPLREKSE